MQSIDQRLGRRARQLRIARKLGVDHVAAALGLTPEAYEQRERGEARFRVLQLYALGQVLGVGMGALFRAPDTAKDVTEDHSSGR